jgi:hypothetical protein
MLVPNLKLGRWFLRDMTIQLLLLDLLGWKKSYFKFNLYVDYTYKYR